MDPGKENTVLVSNDFLRKALREDVGRGDLTTDAIVSKKSKGRGLFIAKQNLILCGLPIVQQLFSLLSSMMKMDSKYKDGDTLKKDMIFGEVVGPLHLLLKGERTSLNLLQRLSGISTLTREYQNKIGKYPTKILDTRKTLPLYRNLEKYAVRTGGGTNHRMGLYDEMMVKDNHISAMAEDIRKAVRVARKRHPKKMLVVEIQKENQIESAIEEGADRLLLDNMTNQQIKSCMKLVRNRIPIEVSGQMTLGRIGALARIGVDFISVGAITHSAPAADISFKVTVT